MALSDDELRARARNSEDNLTERKVENVHQREIRQTVVAFANSVHADHTAVLFIGIGDKGEVHGVTNVPSVEKRVREAIDDCYPTIRYSFRAIDLDGRPVIAVEISRNGEAPHFAGQAYVREGARSIKASERLFAELINRRTDKVNDLLNLRGAPAYEIELFDVAMQRPLARVPGLHALALGFVLDCDRHSVVLRDELSGTVFSVPLHFVSLARNVERNQPKIVIRFRE